MNNPEFKPAQQLLPNEAYYETTWYQNEQNRLFAEAWVFACAADRVQKPGDFVTLRFMDFSLFVLRGADGLLRGFHNLCRHRGCEVLEDSGNTGANVVCPYHRWAYTSEGALRALPNAEACFPDLDKSELSLLPAAVGEHGGLVYINPSPTPRDSFESWIANMDDFAWPHCLTDGSLSYQGEVVYEMQCNWKVFYENAIDGYHLGYLHDQTLGKLYPDANIWRRAGRNVVWYSTERDGAPQSNSILSAQIADGYGAQRLPGHEEAPYPGVVMLFPLTILSPSPWGFYVSVLEPKGPERTDMRTYSWAPAGSAGRFNIGERVEPVRLVDLQEHPLETGNFQIEDMWIVEKIQRNVRSPKFSIGPLAQGAGAESPITHFQESVLEYLNTEPTQEPRA